MVRVAKRLENITYAIRDIYETAKEVEKTKKVHYLNIGDPVLFPDSFSTPRYICDALAKATYDGHNMYADSLGVPALREKLCEYERQNNNITLNPNDILITQGVTEGIMFLNAALIEDGDELLSPGPGYPTYKSYTNMFGGKTTYYKLEEEDNWNPDIDSARKAITDKTKAILVSSPNNPTGSVADSKNIKELIDLAGEHDLIVISDEIYDKIIFQEEYDCPASLGGDVPIVGMNGFSKAHMSTGWRLGYMFFFDPENKITHLKKNIEQLARIRLCANTPAQWAALESLNQPFNHTIRMVENLRRRRDYAYKRMQEIEELSVVLPQGTFYMFPKIHLDSKWKDDKDFVLDLLKETGVCTVFGSGFGKYGEGHLRMTFLPSIAELEIVFNKIEHYLKNKE